MTRIQALPLFPLNVVLFPGQLLPLHIFESRYRTMISECIAGELSFGVVLIREGRDVGEAATPFDVGTTARISRVDRLSDGRMNILCAGDARFKIKSLSHDHPYLTGSVELWPWEPLAKAGAGPRAAQVKKLLTRYMRRLAQATGNTISLEEMPEEAERLANLAAIALQVPNHEKQDLLSAATVGDLLDSCINLLTRENRALSVAASVPADLADTPLPFSTN